MSLEDWLSNSWLTEHKTSPREIKDLLDVADRDITDCQLSQLSADWKLNIAYNAALQTATAALAAAGYTELQMMILARLEGEMQVSRDAVRRRACRPITQSRILFWKATEQVANPTTIA